MQIRLLILWLGISILLSACSGSKTNFERIIALDLDNVDTECDIALSDISSAVSLVQLEAREGAFLNPSSLSSFCIWGDKLFFLDKIGHKILVYDSDGHYVRTISKHGRGHGEYLMENEIFVNPEAASLDVITQDGMIFSYDIDNDYDFLYSRKISEKINSVKNCLLGGDSKGYYFYAPYADHCLGYYELSTGRCSFFDYSVDDILARSLYSSAITTFSLSDGNVLFIEPYSGKVFKLDKDNMSMAPHVLLDAGRFAFKPAKFKKDRVNPMEAMEMLKTKSHTLAAPFNRYLESSRFIISEIYFDEQMRTILYDKQSNANRIFTALKNGIRFSPGQLSGDSMYQLVVPEFLQYFYKIDTDMPASQVETSDHEDGNYYLIKYQLYK